MRNNFVVDFHPVFIEKLSLQFQTRLQADKPQIIHFDTQKLSCLEHVTAVNV